MKKTIWQQLQGAITECLLCGQLPTNQWGYCQRCVRTKLDQIRPLKEGM